LGSYNPVIGEVKVCVDWVLKLANLLDKVSLHRKIEETLRYYRDSRERTLVYDKKEESSEEDRDESSRVDGAALQGRESNLVFDVLQRRRD